MSKKKAKKEMLEKFTAGMSEDDAIFWKGALNNPKAKKHIVKEFENRLKEGFYDSDAEKEVREWLSLAKK